MLWSVDRIAGMLFLPYLAWVTVAGALNLSVLRLNPDADADADAEAAPEV